jgi:hypothetical protein
MNIPMKVYAALVDPNTEAQIIILKDETNKHLLPIWMGSAEAVMIRMALEKVEIARPLTHDLLKEILTYLHFKLDKVMITDVNNSTYYAVLYLEEVVSETLKAKPPRSLQIDARPSDAIALSLRYDAPIYVAEALLNHKESTDGLSEWLARVHPKDFGSFYNV